MSQGPFIAAFMQALEIGQYTMLCASPQEARRRQAQLLAFRRRYRTNPHHDGFYLSIMELMVVARKNEVVCILSREAYHQEQKHE